jgi:hypothetical protein
VLAVAGGADASSQGEPTTWVSVLKRVLGILLLLVAVRNWRDRPRPGEDAPTPKWMGALDRFTPVKAAGAGVLFSALNPKNLLLAVSGGLRSRASVPRLLSSDYPRQGLTGGPTLCLAMA